MRNASYNAAVASPTRKFKYRGGPASHQHRWAVIHAQLGYNVFPCKPRDKKPATPNGFKDATSRLDQVNQWWGRRDKSGSMIGLATGAASGLWVLDVDGTQGEQSLVRLLDKYGALPNTTVVSTPSGGRHYYFRWRGGIRNSAGKLGKGLDVRGEGGYVIAPFSEMSDGRCYEYVSTANPARAPRWLIDLVMGREPAGGGKEAYARKALESECEAVASAPEGERNHTLNKAAFSLGQLVGGGELDETDVQAALGDAAKACGLDDQESRATITSGLSKGMGKPRKAPVRDGAISRARPTKSRRPAEEVDDGSDEPLGGIKLTKFTDIEMQEILWLWPGKVARGEANAIVGDQDVGKTTIVCDIIARTTTGRRWPDEPKGTPRRAPLTVVVINTESNAGGELKPRLKAAGADMSRVEFFEGIRTKGDDGKPIDIGLSLDIHANRLDRMLTDRPDIGLITIDPLDGYTGKINLNNGAQTRQLLLPLVKVARKHKVAILYIVHPNKRTDLELIYRTAGSVAVTAVPRSAFAAVRVPIEEGEEDEGLRVFGPVKHNLTAPQADLQYKIEWAPFADPKVEGGTFVRWLGKSDISARDAMRPINNKNRDKAKKWLERFLTDCGDKNGEVAATEIYKAAKGEGHSKRTLDRAKKDLGVVPRKDGITGGWFWRLSDSARGYPGEPRG